MLTDLQFTSSKKPSKTCPRMMKTCQTLLKYICDIFSDIEYTPQYCGQFSKLKQYADIHKDAISNNYVLIKRQDSSMIEEVTVWLCGIILEYDLPPILSETQYASSSPSSSSSSSSLI